MLFGMLTIHERPTVNCQHFLTPVMNFNPIKLYFQLVTQMRRHVPMVTRSSKKFIDRVSLFTGLDDTDPVFRVGTRLWKVMSVSMTVYTKTGSVFPCRFYPTR